MGFSEGSEDANLNSEGKGPIILKTGQLVATKANLSDPRDLRVLKT